MDGDRRTRILQRPDIQIGRQPALAVVTGHDVEVARVALCVSDAPSEAAAALAVVPPGTTRTGDPGAQATSALIGPVSAWKSRPASVRATWFARRT